jgi:hypothetical protein
MIAKERRKRLPVALAKGFPMQYVLFGSIQVVL